MKSTLLSAGALALTVLAGLTLDSSRQMLVLRTVQVGGRSIVVREARPLKLPAVPGSPVGFDCNNALFWDNKGTLHCFSSHERPFRSSGRDVFHLSDPPTPVSLGANVRTADGGRWIESVYRADSGRVYAWYHEEPHQVVAGRPELTVPRIGQMSSDDDGLTWHDQGLVLEAPADSVQLTTTNRFFAGGNGDFSVIRDRDKTHLYFLFSTYHRDVAEQGVAIARLPIADLDRPSGRVVKWHAGGWNEPGLGGHVTPIFRAEADWHTDDAHAYWGPSIHWNDKLDAYVVLMNRTKNARWDQDGIHVSIAPRLDDPTSWAAPERLLDAENWYPQVIGTNAGRLESDRLAGASARLFVRGESAWEMEFH